MQVFTTGATGWVGAAVVDELLAHGHSVVGLSRSNDKADILRAKGAEVLLGTLEDLDNLYAAAKSADAVAHLGFNHDFTRYVENAALDQRVIETFGKALQGTKNPFLSVQPCPLYVFTAVLQPRKISQPPTPPIPAAPKRRRAD